jgi:deoxyribose-phosphate aldolase
MLKELAKMIDHSILHPKYGQYDLERECAVAKKYGVASVCVKPYMVADAKSLLKKSDVKLGCVVGFPSGNSTIDAKVFETTEACQKGAVEIDMVINIGKALDGDWEYINDEITAVTDAVHSNGAVIKVIFETDYIHQKENIIKLCEICTTAGVDYVKTSTGFGFVKNSEGTYSYTGATIPHLTLMKNSIGPKVKIKAAGGVRTLDQLLAVREAGCSRCGATATATILDEAKERWAHD